MTISAILANHHPDMLTASPDESVGDLVVRLAENRIGALPVIDGKSVIGIFSERDIVYGVAKHGEPS
jgi:CBS domain-containing protein